MNACFTNSRLLIKQMRGVQLKSDKVSRIIQAAFIRSESGNSIMPGRLVKFFGNTIGNIKLKSKKNEGVSERDQNIGSDDTSSRKESPEDHPEVERLRKSIKNSPECFILNNLMMCVEFFNNYDEEIAEMKEILLSSRETTLNNHLLPQKRVLLPDIIHEKIANNVTFTSQRETVEPAVEPLQPIRMFIIHENIQISEPDQFPRYNNSINNIVTYNMRLRPSQNKGYVYLERVRITPPKIIPKPGEDNDLSFIAEDQDGILSDSDSFYYLRPETSTIIKSTFPSPKHNSSSHSELLSVQNHTTASILNHSRRNMSRSLPDLQRESMTRIQQSRVLIGDNRNEDIYSINYTNYNSTTEFKSTQSKIATQNPESVVRRKNSKNTRDNSKLRIQLTKVSPESSTTSSGYKSGNYDSDSDYFGYSTSARIYSKVNSLDTTEIPEICFCQVIYTADDKIYDPDEERKRIVSSKERRIQNERNRHNYDVWYLSSSKFQKYFYNVFIETLVRPLKLEQAIHFRRPNQLGSVIYCDKIEISTIAKCNINESYEIVPCVWTPWPKCLTEWLARSRNSWPSQETIEQIRNFGCFIIPQESGIKEVNFNNKNEWQFAFPAAESYLETCMSHAQMRIFIIILMLHKTFIRAVEFAPVRLNTHQIRHQLFWLMEKIPNKWPENRTGDYLLKLINCLCNCINQSEAYLGDYFLRKRNLFQNSDMRSLFFSLKQLKRILENPVMYTIHAMKNIRYKSNFFPELKYNELLRILTVDQLLLINPNLDKVISSAIQVRSEEEEEYCDRRGGFWNDARKRKEQFSTISQRSLPNRTLISPSRTHDTVVEIGIRCAELKGIRLNKLLNFFIKHLIEMAKNYYHYGAHQQKTDYLNHARNLNILLSEDETFKYEAELNLKVILDLQKLVYISRATSESSENSERNNQTENSSSISNPNTITLSNHLDTGRNSNKKKVFDSITTGKLSSGQNNFSTSWFDDNINNLQNSTSQMKETSDPPLFSQSLKDRYALTSKERSSVSLPVMKKKGETKTVLQNDHSTF